MIRRWMAAPAAGLALAGLLAALAGGCAPKQEAAPGAPPTAEQAQASQKAGQEAAAGQAALHNQPPK